MKALYDKAYDEATGSTQTKTAASGTKYYEYKDLPAYRDVKKFPIIVSPKGETVCYTLENFFQQASPITKAEFDKLVKAQKK